MTPHKDSQFLQILLWGCRESGVQAIRPYFSSFYNKIRSLGYPLIYIYIYIYGHTPPHDPPRSVPLVNTV